MFLLVLIHECQLLLRSMGHVLQKSSVTCEALNFGYVVENINLHHVIDNDYFLQHSPLEEAVEYDNAGVALVLLTGEYEPKISSQLLEKIISGGYV